MLAWVREGQRSESELLSLVKFSKYYVDRDLSTVTAESLEKALAFCKSDGTYMRYRGMLMAVLNLAHSRKWVVEVPRIRPRKVIKRLRVWLTHKQWAALRRELPDHLRPMAEFAIETGLRQANVLNLRWSQVDLKLGTLMIDADEMKADTALVIPLSEGAMNVLKCQEGSHPEFVFTYRNRPIQAVKTAFVAACCRSGVGRIGSDGRYSGFTWHGLRHTWATWHVQNGTPLDVLQKLGGWSDLRMVMNYAHHSMAHLAKFAGNTGEKK